MSWHVAVLPSIHPPTTRRCLKTVKAFDPLVIDNSEVNRGVAASWNIGRAKALREGAEWLTVMSAAIRFGESGGHDWEYALETADVDTIVVEAKYVGWHLISFRRHVLEQVGAFDENFWPAYWEDLDFSWRIRCGFGLDPPYWRKVLIDVTDIGAAHGLRFVLNLGDPRHRPDSERLQTYYKSKHGGLTGQETLDTPWDTGRLDYWPEPIRGADGVIRPNIPAGTHVLEQDPR